MYGIENGLPSRRAENWENLEWLYSAFADRILLIGQSFPEYALQRAVLKRMGRPVGEFDLLIGSTAIIHDLTLVTHNTRDFENLDLIKLENWIDQ